MNLTWNWWFCFYYTTLEVRRWFCWFCRLIWCGFGVVSKVVSVVVVFVSFGMSKRGRPFKSQPTQTEGENAAPFYQTDSIFSLILVHYSVFFVHLYPYFLHYNSIPTLFNCCLKCCPFLSHYYVHLLHYLVGFQHYWCMYILPNW